MREFSRCSGSLASYRSPLGRRSRFAPAAGTFHSFQSTSDHDDVVNTDSKGGRGPGALPPRPGVQDGCGPEGADRVLAGVTRPAHVSQRPRPPHRTEGERQAPRAPLRRRRSRLRWSSSIEGITVAKQRDSWWPRRSKGPEAVRAGGPHGHHGGRSGEDRHSGSTFSALERRRPALAAAFQAAHERPASVMIMMSDTDRG